MWGRLTGNQAFDGFYADELLPAVGNCYEAAFECMFRKRIAVVGKDAELVHALVWPVDGPLAGVRYGHAWLEAGDCVFDLSNGKNGDPLPKLVYYAIGRVSSVTRYTREEACGLALKFRHYGEWEGVCAPHRCSGVDCAGCAVKQEVVVFDGV